MPQAVIDKNDNILHHKLSNEMPPEVVAPVLHRKLLFTNLIYISINAQQQSFDFVMFEWAHEGRMYMYYKSLPLPQLVSFQLRYHNKLPGHCIHTWRYL